MIEFKQLSQWFESHSRPMVLYASQFVDRAEAEDVIQIVFLRLQSLDAPPRDVKAWLFRAAKNTALNSARSRTRRLARETDVGAFSAPWFESRPEDVIDAGQARQLLTGLDEEAREVVVLRIWAGLTFDQIAELSERSRSSVFRLYEQSLTAMRKQLESPCKNLKN
tara:strand:- start:11058 stop:11555 length:498 start_codon:yes stop_codon:yes gene_type:complete